MKKLVCGCFGTIYYAEIRKEGVMSGNRVDVTDDALSAVLSHIMSKKEYDGYCGYEYKTSDGKSVVLCVYDKDNFKVVKKGD